MQGNIEGKVVEYYPMFNPDTIESILFEHWGSRLVSYSVIGKHLF